MPENNMLTANQLFDLAEDYYRGRNGRAKNWATAQQFYLQVIDRDAKHAGALYSLGYMFQLGQFVDGRFVNRDPVRARQYYGDAVAVGGYYGFHSKKQLLILDNSAITTAGLWSDLGNNYYHGRNGKSQDYVLARACYERALYYDSNYSVALYILGLIHLHGAGTERDLVKAREYFEQGAQVGCHHSKKRLLQLDNPDLRTAEQWVTLSEAYYRGNNGRLVDTVFARICCELALELAPHHYNTKKQLLILNNSAAIATANQWDILGDDYYWGRNGKQQDYVLARACYELALGYDNNYNPSIRNLGFLYKYGKGVPKDLFKSREYYERAGNGRRDIKEIERELIENAVNQRASLDLEDAKGQTALHRAAKLSSLKTYARLLYLNADRRRRDREDKTPGRHLNAEQRDKVHRLLPRLARWAQDYKKSATEVIVETKAITFIGAAPANEQILLALNNLYGMTEIKPLLDLTKLAVLGQHRLSQRPHVLNDGYDSDDETDVEEKQRFRIVIDPQIRVLDRVLVLGEDGLGGADAVGMYRPGRNIIYVGQADRELFSEATLVHELCHFVADEVFNNDANPYGNDDEVNRTEFFNICNDMRNRRGELARVFREVFEYYGENDYHSEIIVRVAQFLVENPNDGLATLQRDEPALLGYYQNVFLPKVKEHIIKLEKSAFGNWSPQTFMQIQPVANPPALRR